MPRQIGTPKTGGRQKGTRNKRTLMFGNAVDVLGKAGCNPLEVLAGIATGEHPADLRLKAAAELAAYVYPKRKAIELTSAEGGEGGPTRIEVCYVDATTESRIVSTAWQTTSER